MIHVEPRFKTVEDLEKKINECFESCFEVDADTEEKVQVEPFTITDLAYALGMTRETLLRYEDGSHRSLDDATNMAISDTIKRAKTFIEGYTERQLFKLRNPAGAIFNLINNYKGWSNKQEVIQTTQPVRISKDEDSCNIVLDNWHKGLDIVNILEQGDKLTEN